MPEDTLSENDSTMISPPLFDAAKEVELLVKSIEESSKHCREVLITLLVTSFYVLLAVFARSATDSVTLPLLSISVPDKLFLIVGPLLVLVPYLYLQICVRDLISRLRTFERVAPRLEYVPHRTMLLFPFLLTLGLSMQETESVQPDGTRCPTLSHYDSQLFAATVIVVWWLAPLVLITLWLTFIGRQNWETLFPCAALILSIYGTQTDKKRSTVGKVIAGLTVIVLIAVSFASVPALRNNEVLAFVWKAVQKGGRFIELHSDRILRFAANTLLISLLPAMYVVLFLYQDEKSRLTHWLETLWITEWKRGGRHSVFARVLYPLVNKRPYERLRILWWILVSVALLKLGYSGLGKLFGKLLSQ